MKPDAGKAKCRPLLSEQDFQRLLSAAFTLQGQNDSRRMFALSGANPQNGFAAGAVVQKRTASLSLMRTRNPELQVVRSHGAAVSSLKKSAGEAGIFASRAVAFLAREKNRIAAGLIHVVKPPRWRTVEALAVATVFTMLVSASIRRVSYLRAAAAQQTAQPDATAQNNLTLSGQAGASLKSQLAVRDADFVAKDFVIRYYKRTSDPIVAPVKKLASDRVPAPSQPLPQSITNLKTGVQYTLGKDDDMLAADTVVRYTGSPASGAQPQKKNF